MHGGEIYDPEATQRAAARAAARRDSGRGPADSWEDRSLYDRGITRGLPGSMMPDAWLHIDVKEADGSLTRWMIELGPPNSLLKRGWTKQSVPAGIDVTVVGYQSKDGAKRANGRDITLPNGKQLFAGSSGGTGAPYETK